MNGRRAVQAATGALAVLTLSACSALMPSPEYEDVLTASPTPSDNGPTPVASPTPADAGPTTFDVEAVRAVFAALPETDTYKWGGYRDASQLNLRVAPWSSYTGTPTGCEEFYQAKLLRLEDDWSNDSTDLVMHGKLVDDRGPGTADDVSLASVRVRVLGDDLSLGESLMENVVRAIDVCGDGYEVTNTDIEQVFDDATALESRGPLDGMPEGVEHLAVRADITTDLSFTLAPEQVWGWAVVGNVVIAYNYGIDSSLPGSTLEDAEQRFVDVVNAFADA